MYFVLLVLLVVIIAVLGILILQRRAPEAPPVETPAADDTPAPTQAPDDPEPSDEPEESTPMPTEEPVFEPKPPVETPKPTPTPTPTPEPPKASATGSFASSTGTGLNLRVEWRIYTDGSGKNKLQVDASAVSYSIFTSALYQSLTLNVGGQTYTSNSAAINYDGTALAAHPIASFTMDAPASGSAISMKWEYRGTYSGVALDDIIAEGVIYY